MTAFVQNISNYMLPIKLTLAIIPANPPQTILRVISAALWLADDSFVSFVDGIMEFCSFSNDVWSEMIQDSFIQAKRHCHQPRSGVGQTNKTTKI